MKRFNTFINKEEGITLIETLIAIAISGIILAVIGSLYIFSFNGHKQVQKQAMGLQDITLIKNYFNRELRNVSELKLLSSLPTPIDSNYNYIYLDLDSIILKNNSGDKIIANNIATLNFEVKENITSNNFYSYYLEYKICKEKKTSIILNNLKEYSSGQSQSIIAYKKP